MKSWTPISRQSGENAFKHKQDLLSCATSTCAKKYKYSWSYNVTSRHAQIVKYIHCKDRRAILIRQCDTVSVDLIYGIDEAWPNALFATVAARFNNEEIWKHDYDMDENEKNVTVASVADCIKTGLILRGHITSGTMLTLKSKGILLHRNKILFRTCKSNLSRAKEVTSSRHALKRRGLA